MARTPNDLPAQKGPGRSPERLSTAGAIEMTDDTPKEEWVLWPRKHEAHLMWGVRVHQLAAKIRQGSLTLWACNDGSFRLDPEQLEEAFGPPQPGGRAARGPAARRTLKSAIENIDQDDPYPALLQTMLTMMTDLRDDNRKILQMVLDPANQHVKNLLDTTDRLSRRVIELENRWQQSEDRRGVELEQLRAFELERMKAENQEKRRAAILATLQQQIPSLVAKIGGGPSVIDFIKDVPDEMIEMLLLDENDTLNPEKKAQLRAAWVQAKVVRETMARAQKPKAHPSADNGAHPTNGAPSA